MDTAIAHTRNINIEASSLVLDTTSTEKRSYQYNKLSTLFYRYQYFKYLYRSKPLYLAYITPVFLTSSSIQLRLRSSLSEYLTLKLPSNSILILLIVTETNVWQRHSYSKTHKTFRAKTSEDYLNRRSPHPYTGIRDT